MLDPIYESISERLASLELPVEWYNVQYEESMIHDAGFFVEFPDRIPIDELSKDAMRAPVKIRLHTYSKALRTNDGIPAETIQDHEKKAKDARDLLRNWAPEGCKKLNWTGWQHWHRWKGWMVTFVEFETKMMV